MGAKAIPGYDYGSSSVVRSPINLEEWDFLKKSVAFAPEDEQYLRLAGKVLADQIPEILDVWYGHVMSQPFLLSYFNRPDGQVDLNYLTAVRRRFGQWILDTCNRAFDQDWLDYQAEIGLRHHRLKKNRTDHVTSAPHIPLRYLIAFIYPITATLRPFLAHQGHRPEEVEGMFQAWFKAVVLTVTLWSQPYAQEGDF